MKNNVELACAHLYLSGRVQGVGMRFYVYSLAARHALCGWVRNLPDGRVEAVLQGPRTKVERMVEEIRRGEYAKHINELACQWENPSQSFPDFQITY